MQLSRISIISGWITIILLTSRVVYAASSVHIDAPFSGSAVQGVVNISGSTKVDGYQSTETAFAYQSDPQIWFLIASSDKPVEKGVVAVWDTTTIADGVYLLRVKVTLRGGVTQEAQVNGIRVQNDTTVLTPLAPAGQQTLIEPSQVAAGIARILPTPTALPENPATIGALDLSFHAVQGAVSVLILFGIFGIYLGFRRLINGH